MKAILLLLLFQIPAYAMNETFLRMPPNPEYMTFAMKRYLSWHRKNFNFPPENPLIDKLAGGLDNWTISSLYLRQLTMTHFENENGKLDFRIRIYVQPNLRTVKELMGPGLPSNKELWFSEWSADGSTCRIFREEDGKNFSSWCHGKNEKIFVKSWDEKISHDLPEGWRLSFPVMGQEFLQKKNKDGISEIMFFDVSPHPSIIPVVLRRSAYLHTKDSLFPLDRMSSIKGNRMGLNYP